ncbi:MAG: sulfite exporter TauE/SafE family protein [Dehalococcoidia bacterium]|nr:sulfite exporter TauE/SafE family protein [Dehalococcoidia bacterium]
MDPLQAVVLVLVGIAIGSYATAIGAGGGFLITPLLLVLYPSVEAVEVTTASLTIVLFSSIASTLIMWREQLMDLPLVGALAVLAIPFALLGGYATSFVPREAFAIGFAVLLGGIGAYLIWRPVAGIAAPARIAWDRLHEAGDGTSYAYRIPILPSIPANAGTAFLGALAGIGGGAIGVPIMTRIMRVPHPIATTSMHALIVIQSAFVVGMHLAADHQGEPMEAVPWLALGGVLGSPAGRILRRRLGEGPLMRALALGLFFIAARTAWGAFE